ncbi:MAG: AsnC family transcriptional regulator [Candidatus Adiutrix sp.]|jgi:Lrp/AsnC family transcriptional regulator for asnA, asnC and gidA|nr:AsnC family transcriptional regulator [Candidatus Adiutrix sp.]
MAGGAKIDKTEVEIIKLLQRGRRSFKDIGQTLGLSEATIRSKVGKMTQDGLVEIKALVSTKDMEVGYQTAYIGLRLKTPAIMPTAEALTELPGTISVAMVTGRYDLILTIMLTPEFGLLDFLNIMLVKYSDRINSSETFLVCEAVNLKTPYPY